MTVLAPTLIPAAELQGSVDRLLVTVRDPESGAYRSVGFLTQNTEGYVFDYLRAEVERDGFRPLPGLRRATGGSLPSADLFPLFAERVISSRRPDRQVSLEALGLTVDEAVPFEVLLRSHGQRVGDTLELLPAPRATAGERIAFSFPTHGVRHLDPEEQGRISDLAPGELLTLVPDHENQFNPRALLVTDSSEIRLGWVPNPLVEVIEATDAPTLQVERANGPEVGFHFRLLVQLQGVVRQDAGLFVGPSWATV